MSNLDRFMEASIPQIKVKHDSLSDLVDFYHKISINGLKVELQDDKDQYSKHMGIFLPTLSSMYFSMKDEKRQDIIEFHQ